MTEFLPTFIIKHADLPALHPRHGTLSRQVTPARQLTPAEQYAVQTGYQRLTNLKKQQEYNPTAVAASGAATGLASTALTGTWEGLSTRKLPSGKSLALTGLVTTALGAGVAHIQQRRKQRLAEQLFPREVENFKKLVHSL